MRRASKVSQEYLSFQQAKQILAQRLGATPEEIAVWVWYGPEHGGGLVAYADSTPAPCCKADVCPDYQRDRCATLSPRRFHFPDSGSVAKDVTPANLLADCYFQKTAVVAFAPDRVGRFISWSQLFERWKMFGLSDDEIRRKVVGRIECGELIDHMPIYGCTQLSGHTDAAGEGAMFEVEQVEAIQARDFAGLQQTAATSESAVAETSGMVAWQAEMLKAWSRIHKDGKDSGREAIRWLQKNGPADTFVRNSTSRDQFEWFDRDGDRHTQTIKAAQNVISKWRKDGLIPPKSK